MIVEVPSIEKSNNQSLGIHCREEYQNVICKWKPHKIYEKVRSWAGELYVDDMSSTEIKKLNNSCILMEKSKIQQFGKMTNH